MSNLKVVFHSGTGNTKAVAQSIYEGANKISNAELLEIKGDMIKNGRFENEEFLNKLDTADSIIFGSPTYMGMVSGQMKCFLDATSSRWMEGKWNSKLASGFTSSLGLSGDKQSTLSYLVTFASQHGMIWVSCDVPNGLFQGQSMEEATNRLSSNTGVMSQVNFGDEFSPTKGDLKTAELHGLRVATLTNKFCSD